MVLSIEKRISSLTLTAVILATSAAGTLAAEESSFETAAEATSNIVSGWNLGNTLDSYGTWIDKNGGTKAYETAWGNVETTQEMIDSVRDQGFNAIRIPVTWSQHIDSKGNVDSAWMKRVKQVVNYCYNDGLYVILNVHHDTGEGGGDKVSWIFADSTTYSNTKTKFKGLWTNIANEFKDYGDKLLFEGYNEMLDKNNSWNEPSDSASYKAVNNYAQLFVDTVRATGGNNANRNLIVNNYVCSIYKSTLDNFKVPTDSAKDHLICEVHCYDPWAFTGTKSVVTWTSVHDSFTGSDKTEIDTIMNRLKTFSDNNKIPVIIGEYGAMYKSNTSAIADYASYFVDAAGMRGIKCFYWDNGKYNTTGEYCLFDRKNNKWKTSVTKAIKKAATPYSTQNPDGPIPPVNPMYVNGWNKDSKGWFYISSGKKVVSKFKTIKKKKYYFNSKGYMVTGVKTIKGKKYYFNKSGALTTGWKKSGGKWYYFTTKGAKTGWKKIKGKWYYFIPSKYGAMATGKIKIKGKTYKFSSSGVWKK